LRNFHAYWQTVVDDFNVRQISFFLIAPAQLQIQVEML